MLSYRRASVRGSENGGAQASWRVCEIQMRQTKQRWLPIFLDFIEHFTIMSKEIPGDRPEALSSIMYDAQIKFLEEVCEGLDRGIRHFVCLKARQLGISTISLAIDVFWLSLHPGLQG